MEFLRQKRIELGFTQAAAAAKIGKHATTWSQYETGLILPDLKTFRRIARLLECDVQLLLNSLLRGYTGTASVTSLHAERAKRRRG